jgi:stage II sporulation protein D
LKRIIVYIGVIVLATFLLPLLLTKKFGTEEVVSGEVVENVGENEEKSNANDYQYSSFETIKLLHNSTGEVEEIPIDEYLLGVVSAEMPASFKKEALKAQAIVARTYTVYMIKNSKKHDNADICDNSACCQAWISKEDRLAKWEESKREENWEKIRSSVYETQGKIITYNGEVIEAFFHSNSGGKTEEVSNVWGGTNMPYLQSVETSGEDAYSQYLSEATFTKSDFENKIKEKHSDFSIDYADPECIKVVEYTAGNRIKTIKIGNLNLSGVEVRTLLGLKSANFNVEISENEIKFVVKGYGHGVRNESNWS